MRVFQSTKLHDLQASASLTHRLALTDQLDHVLDASILGKVITSWVKFAFGAHLSNLHNLNDTILDNECATFAAIRFHAEFEIGPVAPIGMGRIKGSLVLAGQLIAKCFFELLLGVCNEPAEV